MSRESKGQDCVDIDTSIEFDTTTIIRTPRVDENLLILQCIPETATFNS